MARMARGHSSLSSSSKVEKVQFDPFLLEEREEDPAAAIDPPDLRRSLLAPGLVEVEDNSLVGEYSWRLSDGSSESLLRLRADGKFWHVAQHVSEVAASLFPWGLTDSSAAEEAWELAETIGSWNEVPIPGDVVGRTDRPGRGAVLVCENFRWSRSKPAESPSPVETEFDDDSWLLGAAPTLRPTRAEKLELDAAVAEGRLVLCFAACELAGAGEGGTHLELQMPAEFAAAASSFERVPCEDSRSRLMMAAVRALGFAERYDSDDLEPEEEADDLITHGQKYPASIF